MQELSFFNSIYDLVEKQNEVTTKVAQAMLARMADYPIDISQTTITNWDWSDDFDKQIKETANRAQEVKKSALQKCSLFLYL